MLAGILDAELPQGNLQTRYRECFAFWLRILSRPVAPCQIILRPSGPARWARNAARASPASRLQPSSEPSPSCRPVGFRQGDRRRPSVRPKSRRRARAATLEHAGHEDDGTGHCSPSACPHERSERSIRLRKPGPALHFGEAAAAGTSLHAERLAAKKRPQAGGKDPGLGPLGLNNGLADASKTHADQTRDRLRPFLLAG